MNADSSPTYRGRSFLSSGVDKSAIGIDGNKNGQLSYPITSVKVDFSDRYMYKAYITAGNREYAYDNTFETLVGKNYSLIDQNTWARMKCELLECDSSNPEPCLNVVYDKGEIFCKLIISENQINMLTKNQIKEKQ